MKEDIQAIIITVNEVVEKECSQIGKMIAMAEGFKLIKNVIISSRNVKCN